MKKYFMGISWINMHQPIIHLKDFISSSDEYIDVPSIFDMKNLRSKICCGAINPLTREMFPCNKLIDINQLQCYDCMHKYDFYNCVRCHGNKCASKNIEVIRYCNSPHYVYLAYFSKDKIKVGTASEIRKFDRLLEQGAIFSAFIAKTPTGKIARQIEKSIIDSGMIGSVSTSFKMKNLVFYETAEEIKKSLVNAYRMVMQDIEIENFKYLIQPDFNYFDKIREDIEECILSQREQIDIFNSQLFKINNYEISKESDCIEGEFLFAVGKIIALKHNGVIHLYDSKKWEGFLFDFKGEKTFLYRNKRRESI